MFNWFKKERWLLVHTIEYNTILESYGEQGKSFFYFFESNKGNRKYETKNTYTKPTRHAALPLYLEKIFPWTKGANFPDIPSYWPALKEKQFDTIKDIYRCLPKY